MAAYALIFLGLSAFAAQQSAGNVLLHIYFTGEYFFTVDGKVWLPSADTYFYVNGQKYSKADGTLKHVGYTEEKGIDKIGKWQDSNFHYDAGGTVILCTIRFYPYKAFFIFTQKYLNTTYDTSSGDVMSVSSAFPSFQIIGNPGEFGYISYGGAQFGGTSIKIGNWTNSTSSKTSINTGSETSPIILFDQNGHVLIQSSFNQFMSSSVYKEGNNVSWGVQGGVDYIPAMYESSTIVFYGSSGINKAMSDFGDLMRLWYDRDQSYTDSDLLNNYLGYWTDNGAYYYYNTEKKKNYEQTIIDIKHYADKMRIPYRYVQFDSWWYYKGALEGVVTWDAMPSIFPHGLEYLYNKTEWPVCAHNRWWSVNNTYAIQNGGKYKFIIEETESLPMDKNFWRDLLGEAKKWGLITYEQDWLDKQFSSLNVTRKTLDAARDWLMQMGEGAAENGLTIQYCMSNPKEALQTLEIPVVTSARVSHDYHPSLMLNWNIGLTSIFADALGVRPFKDNFWTSKLEPKDTRKPWDSLVETSPQLESVISTLSTGPVGPSDMIGGSNVTLIMMSCNNDGLLLQPSRPARNIDSNIIEKAFGTGNGPDGEVWATYSNISGGFFFGIILAPIQIRPVQVTPTDAGFGDTFPDSVIFKHTWPSPTGLANFSDTEPLTIAGCKTTDPCLWHTAPIIQFGDTSAFIYGELKKWVPMSPKRVIRLDISDDIYVTVVGAVDETIYFSFGTVGSSVVNTVTCQLGLSGSAIIQYLAKRCTPL